MSKHLTTNFKDIYQTGRSGAWTWLNARFVKGSGFNNLDLEKIVGIEQNGDLKTKKEPLMLCLDDNIYAELKFNAQGFPTHKAGDQKYEQGKNMWFYQPTKDAVARFNAYSGRANFGCYGIPQSSDASLGVFLCAEN